MFSPGKVAKKLKKKKKMDEDLDGIERTDGMFVRVTPYRKKLRQRPNTSQE